MSDKGITCDMSNVEYIGHVRERCHLTIQNTNAGPYIEELCGRLLLSSAERSRLETENERLREALASPCSYSYQAGGRCCGCKNCRRIKALQRGEDDE